MLLNPVALPPGRPRLATKPSRTGSFAVANTIGMVRVACHAALAAIDGGAYTSSGLRATSSVARRGRSSCRSSAKARS